MRRKGTQEHLLEECRGLNDDELDKITTQEIFESDTDKLRITENKINIKVMTNSMTR